MEIIRTEILSQTAWLEFKQKIYLDREGRERNWAFVERVGGQKAVFIIPLDPKRRKILLIRQYRVPLAKYVVEFPAGLIDEWESVAETAQRELIEETGFSGVILNLSGALAMSSGITSESAYAALVEVDLDPSHRQPQLLETAEDIEPLIVSLDELATFLAEREKKGDIIDGKLYCFGLGLALSSLINARCNSAS